MNWLLTNLGYKTVDLCFPLSSAGSHSPTNYYVLLSFALIANMVQIKLSVAFFLAAATIAHVVALPASHGVQPENTGTQPAAFLHDLPSWVIKNVIFFEFVFGIRITVTGIHTFLQNYMREYMLNDRLCLCHGYIVPRPARRILNWIDKLPVENTQGRTQVVRPPARNQVEWVYFIIQ